MTTVTLRSTKAEIFRALDIATAELALAREQLSQLRNDNLRLEAEVSKLNTHVQSLGHIPNVNTKQFQQMYE